MNRYFTVMIIPEREKGVKSFRVPHLVMISVSFLIVAGSIFIGILAYNYYQIQQQLYENKQLNQVNRQLRDRIQNFQRKLNIITNDIERIHTFEKKLRIITGASLEGELGEELSPEEENSQLQKDGFSGNIDNEEFEPVSQNEKRKDPLNIFEWKKNLSNIEQQDEYQEFKRNHELQIAQLFNEERSYNLTKEWSLQTKRTYALAKDYAQFDYKYKQLSQITKDLEIKVHQLDQYLLDKESYLRSTPTLLPTKGWVTSYYGPRKSPYSGRLKMHEGIDVGARTGTPIVAPADGVITFAGNKPGYGKFVQIDHGYGVETIFGHAQKVLTKKGLKVKRGDKIAKVGNTGSSTGPHLHYEVRVNGIPVDPLYFILD